MASEESLKSRGGLEVGLRAQQRTSLEQIINSAPAGSVSVLDSTCISVPAISLASCTLSEI